MITTAYLAHTRAAQRGGSDFLSLFSLYTIGQTDKDSSKVDVRQYCDKAFVSSIWRIAEASHRALGLLIIVIIVLLLSRGNGRLGWRW